ncbi:MAG: TonB-dependent receptor [Chitinophagaceae bacterium]|nr:TonB-dependent receptor [Chitinophagaceae bacterium]
MSRKYILLCTIGLTQMLYSQEDSLKTLSEVVVTGQYKPQTARYSVYQVRIIQGSQILKQGSINMETFLRNELKVRFAQDLATGGSNMTMLGLQGQNIKILIDGLPVTGRQGTSNEINIHQIDVNTIERIEIIEGPMSVIYGADALGGVINIITKKNTPHTLSVSARLHEESVGNEYRFFHQGIHNQSLQLSYKKNSWELGGGFSHNFFGGWKDTLPDRELLWHRKDQRMANAFAGYRREKLQVRYRFDGLDEVIYNPGNFLLYQPFSGDTIAQDQEYLTQRMMHQLQGAYTLSERSDIQWQTAFSDYSRQVFSTIVSKKTGKVSMDITPGSQSQVHFTGFTFRGILSQKISEKMSLQPGVDIHLERGSGERLQQGTNAIDDYAFFITSEIAPIHSLKIRPGLRVMKNSVYNSPPVIPSLHALFRISELSDIRLSYSRGFRAPSLRELYFNFFDANHQIIGNPNLKAETSNSFTGYVNHMMVIRKATQMTLQLGFFYNNVENLIGYAVSPVNPSVFQYANISNARTAGGHFSAGIKNKLWNVESGVSITGFYNRFSEVDEKLPVLLWSPEVNLLAEYLWEKQHLSVNVFYKFTGKRPFYTYNSSNQIVQGSLNGFHTADLALTKGAGKYLKIQAGVRNLFNVIRLNQPIGSGGAHGQTAQRNIATGRAFFAGLQFQWNQ